ncbi:hypothetical protein [Amycolatopsis sp. 195334CR]|uniref:hypothetical protein n=1 Tax=Amycolatopsis sp. 195334CR TaxID=2814588 RepID=UPI001A8D6109|nr:hypothetical protein [Amycolatopsis sp. 195334CR]MBN6037486.1 hypothetical protein [Amycolatopsis sp. 195334CR]
MPWWVTILVAVLSVFGGGTLGSLLSVRRVGRKIAAETEQSRADAVTVIAEAAKGMVEPLAKSLKVAEERADRLNNKLMLAEAEVQELRGQVERLTKDVQAKQAELDELKGAR